METLQNQGLGQSSEDYLKAIFRLEAEGLAVSTSGLARTLHVSPAAVTKAVRHLGQRELVSYTPYHGFQLTAKGRAEALRTIRQHRLIELFLHDMLGFGWEEVDEEAERLEHHISLKLAARIEEALNYPKFDPHGSPIPSVDGTMVARSGDMLSHCSPGDEVVVREVDDRLPRVLEYLAVLGLRPGRVLRVLDKAPFDGPITLQIGESVRAVAVNIAACIRVESTTKSDPAA
jgi:DtxR family Mn-dependent transcriptional regulator